MDINDHASSPAGDRHDRFLSALIDLVLLSETICDPLTRRLLKMALLHETDLALAAREKE